jgi:TfoX/Sxy family transcriptional regulator of competence genes
MAYDEALADRIRRALGPRPGVDEKKMFGGLAFLLEGKMFCGIVGDDLMVRVGPEGHDDALRRPHVRPMDFTGRPMKGYVYVAPAGCKSDRALADWVDRGARFAATLEDQPQRKRRPTSRA